jgi:DNA-binding MarR family transcriptional regulator
MSGTIANRQHAVKTDDRTPAGRALAGLAVQVFRLEGLLSASGDALAAPSGQTTARWRVLAAVEAAPLTVAQIARAWSLARQSVQRVADLLARDGLVAYAPNPGHQRAKLVVLTPAGEAVLGRIQLAQRAWADELGARLDADELAQAGAILERVATALGERGDA